MENTKNCETCQECLDRSRGKGKLTAYQVMKLGKIVKEIDEVAIGMNKNQLHNFTKALEHHLNVCREKYEIRLITGAVEE